MALKDTKEQLKNISEQGKQLKGNMEKHGKQLKMTFWTIPNLLTLLRILMIPGIIYLYIVKEDVLHTAVLLFFSGVTDTVDGYIARHFDMISDVGKALDPIADKLTQVSVLICLINQTQWMLLPVGILFVKEFVSFILSLAVFQKTGKVEGADWHGKVTTCLLYLLMAVHILWINIPKYLSVASILICSCMMLLSFALYALRHLRDLEEGGDA